MVYRTTPKMAQRKEAQRAHLLEVAIELFGRQGYHATTVPSLVQAAGVSTGTFYFYFRNKEDVFAAALERFGERIAQELNVALAAAGEAPTARMRAAVERLMQFMAENPHEARILIVESSGLSERLQEIRRRVVNSHVRSVELALAELNPPPAAPAVIARCWVGAVYESVFHWLEQPEGDRPEAGALARVVADFNLRGAGAL